MFPFCCKISLIPQIQTHMQLNNLNSHFEGGRGGGGRVSNRVGGWVVSCLSWVRDPPCIRVMYTHFLTLTQTLGAIANLDRAWGSSYISLFYLQTNTTHPRDLASPLGGGGGWRNDYEFIGKERSAETERNVLIHYLTLSHFNRVNYEKG